MTTDKLSKLRVVMYHFQIRSNWISHIVTLKHNSLLLAQIFTVSKESVIISIYKTKSFNRSIPSLNHSGIYTKIVLVWVVIQFVLFLVIIMWFSCTKLDIYVVICLILPTPGPALTQLDQLLPIGTCA